MIRISCQIALVLKRFTRRRYQGVGIAAGVGTPHHIGDTVHGVGFSSTFERHRLFNRPNRNRTRLSCTCVLRNQFKDVAFCFVIPVRVTEISSGVTGVMAHEKLFSGILDAITVHVNYRGQQYTLTRLQVYYQTTIGRSKTGTEHTWRSKQRHANYKNPNNG